MGRSSRHQRVVWRVRLIVMGANVCGSVLIAFYFSNIHGGYAQDPSARFGTNVGTLILATVGLLVLGNVSSSRWLAPLWAWYRQAERPAEPGQAPPQIRRLALNLPAISAGTTMAMWFLAGLLFSLFNGLDSVGGRFDWAKAGQVMLGSEIAGSITAVLIYFALERVWRTELPIFFAGEDLTKTPAFRLRVRVRMLILFVSGAMPLLDLAALSYSQAIQIASAPEPRALLPRLLVLNLFLTGSGILAAVVLARTLGASLVEPLESLSQRMSAVEEGDLDVRMPVTSNDEIGVMSQCFNSMVESLKRRNVELQTVYQISQEITASLELEQTMRTVLERVRQMIAYDGAEVCLYDQKERVLRVRAWAGSDRVRADTQGRTYQLGEGCTGWVGEHRQSLLVPDIDVQQAQRPVTREIADGVALNSYLGTPLVAGQKLVGTLELVSVREGAFDEHTRQLLETIAPQAAIAIENAAQVLERERQLKEQIEQLRIEINEAKRARQVAEVTETEYFQRLQKRAQQIRGTSERETG